MFRTLTFSLAAFIQLGAALKLLEESNTTVDMVKQSPSVVDSPEEPQEKAVASKDNNIETISLDNLSKTEKALLENTGISLKPGEQTRISVSGNPTTGYEWYQLCCEDNGAFTVERAYRRDPTKPKNYTGVGGMYYFTLTARQPPSGEDSVSGLFEIAYYRDWEDEGEENALSKYSIPVNVTA